MPYSDEIKEFHRYLPGVPEAPELRAIPKRYMAYMAGSEKDPTKHSSGPNRLTVDLAWVICLLEAGVLDRARAGKLLRATLAIQKGAVQLTHSDSHGYAERNLIEALQGDEDLASLVNVGRTLQEPMSRLDLRDKLIETLEDLLALLNTVIEVAETNADTVMPGHTHLSQAQPVTLAHYLLSVCDALMRGIRQMELAFADTNLNSGGCGATSGITWPVDRTRMADLLGFDGIIEPCYDAEASQDHSMSILFGLTNICLLISKTSMDMNIWGMEEIDMLKTDYSWCGVSSMMPNKCIPGSLFERARIEAGYVVGQMMQAATLIKGEPHGDMLPMLEPPKIACHAMAHALAAMGYLRGLLKNIIPQKETMLAYVREGFSCTSEVAAYMVKNLGFGPRRAHRIVATMVRFARERRLKAYECTGDLLDEAAVFAEESKPVIDTTTLRRLLDPEHFIQTHCHRGGTAPKEALRMLASRRKEAQSMQKRHEDRKTRIQEAQELLKGAIDAILE